MHLYGAIVFTQDQATRRVPLLAAWDLSPFSWLRRQQMQDQMTSDAKELAEETSPNDQVQFETDHYTALSSGRPVEDELCGVILTDSEYPRDVAIAVLDKMLEEMAVRVPKARYQGRIAQLVAQRPRDFAPGQGGALPEHQVPEEEADPSAFAGWGNGCMPRLGDSDAFDPIQAEFDRRNAEGRRLGIDEPVLVAALEFPSAQEYLSRYQNLQLAQSLARNQFESRTTGGAAFGVASGRLPNKKRSFLGMRRAQRGAQSAAEARPPTLRTVQYHSSLGSMSGGQPSPKHINLTPPVPEDAPLPPTPSTSVRSPLGPVAAPPRSDAPQTASPRRSTLSGPSLSPIPQPADVASRSRSATVGFGGPHPDSTVGSALKKPPMEEGGKSVQASLSALRSMTSRSTASGPVSDTAADSDADGDDGVRTPTPLAGFGAVRAALASSSPHSGRTQRLMAAKAHGGDTASKTEDPAPIILERRAPVAPIPDELEEDAPEQRLSRFAAKPTMPSLGRTKYHTAHPTGAPTASSLSPGATLSGPERRSSHVAPHSTSPDLTKKEIQRPVHSVAGSLRIGVPGRKRAATEGDENCIVM